MTYDHDRLDRFATVALARLPGSRTRLYAGLLTFRNSTTYRCWPSVRTLAALTELSPRTVKSCLRDLVGVGLIRRTFRGRGGNLYVFARGAVHHFPDLPAVAPKPAPEVQPPLTMAVPDPVDNLEKWGNNGATMGQNLAPITREMGQNLAPPTEPTKIFEPGRTPPPVVGQPTHHGGAAENSGGEETTNDEPPADPLAAEVAAAVVKIRDTYLGGVWPRHPEAPWWVRKWMTAGWPRDEIGHYLAERIASSLVRDPGAVVKTHLAGDPPPAPVVPDHARPLVWHARRDAARRAAEQRKDADDGATVTTLPTGRPQVPPDVSSAMFASYLRDERYEDALAALEPRTRAVTGTEG